MGCKKAVNVGVLGSSGYLGSNITQYLEGKHKVTRLSLRSECKTNQIYVGVWGREDIHRLGLDHLVICTSPDARTCKEDPIGTLKLVLIELERFIRLACRCGVRRVVYLSTCRVYKGDETKITEKSQVDHKDIYSLSHLLGESMIKDICLRHGVSGISLRLSNVFGTRVETSRESRMWQLAANSFMSDIALKRKVLIMSPEAERDFIPVSVVVQAVENFIGQENMGSQFEVVNIASGYTLSMLEIKDILIDISSGRISEGSIEDKISRCNGNACGRRIIDRERALQLGLFQKTDILAGYIGDSVHTMRLVARENSAQ